MGILDLFKKKVKSTFPENELEHFAYCRILLNYFTFTTTLPFARPRATYSNASLVC
jgi:hypothetical protein